MKYTLKKISSFQSNSKTLKTEMEHIRNLIHSTLDFDEMVNKLISAASKAINCDSAAISLRQHDRWQVSYSYGFKEDIIGTIMNDTEERHAVLAIQTKKPVIINDTASDPRVNFEHLSKWDIRAVIVIPLLCKDQVFGVLFFDFLEARASFEEEIIEFVNALSSTIYLALQNIKMYQLAKSELEERKRALEKCKRLFNSINDGFCIIEMIFDSFNKPKDFRILEVNPMFKKISKLTAPEGKLMKELMPNHEDYWYEMLSQVALTGKPVRYINKSTSLDRWFRVNAFTIDQEKNNLIAVLFSDITEDVRKRKEMEDNLKIQDEIFANVSHELKTPLNVIYSTNQLIDLYLKIPSLNYSSDKLTKFTHTIKQNCYRFTKLIENIVDLSKINSGFLKLNLSNENIIEVIENIVQSVTDFAAEKGKSIIFDTNTEEKIIACDPYMLERILLNLISNAMKFTNKDDTIYVNIYDKEDTVVISVQDTGVGIEEKHLDLIFDKFFQVDKTLARNTEGSGLGLSLVKQLVELHQGNISVESEVGIGTTFTIELPVRKIEISKKEEMQKIRRDNIEMMIIEFSDIYHI